MKYQIGDDVNVYGPKHSDTSIHSHSFNGTIVDIVDDTYIVEDQDSDFFPIEEDEIDPVPDLTTWHDKE